MRRGRIRRLLAGSSGAYDPDMGVDVASGRSRFRAARWVALAALAGTAFGSACHAPARQADFDSIDPSERSAAAAQAASERDRDAVPDLIVMLDSSDPASRMVAIAALERITGERLGYSATDDRVERNAAVRRWVKYANDNGYLGTAREKGAVAPVPSRTGDGEG